MKRLIPYYKLLLEHKWAFLGSVACAVFYGAATGAGLPYVIKYVFPILFDSPEAALQREPSSLTRLLGENPDPDAVLLFTIVLLPITLIVRSVCGFFNAYLTAYCGVKVLEALRMRLFDRIQELHLEYFQKHKSGDLLSRMMGDSFMLKSAIVNASNSIVREPFTFAAAVAFLVYLCIENNENLFILLCLVAVPLCVVPIRYVGKRLSAKAARLQRQAGTVTECASENLRAAREIRAFNLQGREREKFAGIVSRFISYQLKVVKYDKMLGPIIELATGLVITAAIYFAARARLDLEAEEVAALFIALHACYEPVKGVGSIHNQIRKGLASLDRIEEVINHPIEVADPPDPVPLPDRIDGALHFDDVSFTYGSGPVLTDISCRLDPGNAYALVGPSGAGKSTFIKLILRFYDPTSGRITLDGIDLRRLAQHDLRSRIALVPQDPVLFNASIMENLQMVRPGATDAEVVEAARRAHADDFIQSFPEGYQTVVGERGTRLSGGQKQRLAIARAVLKDSPILILDEATSALDSESESRVQDALKTLVAGKTVVMIAHRFSTLKMADEILVFDAGRLSGRGTREELIRENAVYQNLYAKQELD